MDGWREHLCQQHLVSHSCCSHTVLQFVTGGFNGKIPTMVVFSQGTSTLLIRFPHLFSVGAADYISVFESTPQFLLFSCYTFLLIFHHDW